MSTKLSRLIPALLLVLVVSSAIVLILSLVKRQNVFLPSSNKYGMVFDAGSSHTSLFVYQWAADKENDTGVVSQTLSCDVQGPGISAYASDPPKAGASLRSCLEEALKIIPAESHREVPAYLGATAGMRLLSIENRSAADQVLNEVTKTIQQYPVNFRGARIITGEEEGTYGWITINYLLDSFTQYSPRQRDWIHPQSAKILGALDLGGASTQISFIPKGPIVDQTKAAKFRLYGYDYTIYTQSYLCYGQTQALKQLLLKLTENANVQDSVSHPCYPEGYQENTTIASIRSSPCTASHVLTHSRVSMVTLMGTGNATECRVAFKQIFNFTACGESQFCSFDGIYQPPVNGEFFAFSAFYYTFSFLNLTGGQSLAEVEAAVQKFCARNWTDLKSSYPKEKEKWLLEYCSNANYILVLLLDAYKFNQTSWSSVKFQMKAANTDIGWTLGYMLNLTNMIPAEALVQVNGQQYGLWIAGIFVIVLTLVLCLVGLLMYLL
ncbi:ectonucleoside triphosphate diphosphohydrolase 8-like isoform X1 [Carettochelys insculpta]|uniref:ectonucleoside triphosphate diphosphohydrolase 8-like isoform X1 n=1 Tax=Carettochelys insculpta TaxID=44489 RepID=UPI003EB98AF1